MQRGDVWWASLPEPLEAEPGYRRPVIIMQADSFNRSAIQTVICVVLTTNLRLREAPGNLYVAASQSGLPKDSVANVSQLITIDRRFLTEFVARLPAKKMNQLSDGLRRVLSL